jgi:hypothetical protein
MFGAVDTSRREFVAGIALLGASSLLGGKGDTAAAQTSQPTTRADWSADDRKKAVDRLVSYFGNTAPQLLRPAEGVLAHPSIACSLPGKRYATNLWDWEERW